MKKTKFFILVLISICFAIGLSSYTYAESNKSFKSYMTVKVVDESDTDTGIENAVFTLYKYNEKTEKYKKLETLVTDKEGKGTFTITKKGKYKVKQTASARDYSLDEKPFTTTFTIKNTKKYNKRTVDLTNGKPIVNKKRLGSITIYRTGAENSTVFPYVVYEKVGNDGLLGVIQAFLTGKAYEIVNLENYPMKTNKDGSVTISGLPCASYYVANVDEDGNKTDEEDKLCEFSLSSEEGYDVVLRLIDNALEVDTRMYIQFVDSETGLGLEGGTYELIGMFSDGSTKYKWTGHDAGKEINDLLVAGNNYVLKQTKAAKGYKKIKSSILIELDEEGHIIASDEKNTVIGDHDIVVEVGKEK